MKKLIAAFIIVLAVSSTSLVSQADNGPTIMPLDKTEIVG